MNIFLRRMCAQEDLSSCEPIEQPAIMNRDQLLIMEENGKMDKYEAEKKCSSMDIGQDFTVRFPFCCVIPSVKILMI